jgi:hypothetical protein
MPRHATPRRSLNMERASTAQHAGSKVNLISGSHAVLISQPMAVAVVIDAAVRPV